MTKETTVNEIPQSEFVKKGQEIVRGNTIEYSLSDILTQGVLPTRDLVDILNGYRTVPVLLRPPRKPTSRAHVGRFGILRMSDDAYVSTLYPTERVHTAGWFSSEPLEHLMQVMNPLTTGRGLSKSMKLPERIEMSHKSNTGIDEDGETSVKLGDQYYIYYTRLPIGRIPESNTTDLTAVETISALQSFEELLRDQMHFAVTTSAELYNLVENKLQTHPESEF